MGSRQSCGKACSNCTADCTRSAQGYGDDFDDERPGGDPAGATFEETLEDLNALDRQLLLFCATSNLSAVRWLLHLGAHWDACDANSTTCLHVACRAGALAIVKELLQYRELLKALDVAGWTALHIAVLMGRREVVVLLLQAGTPPQVRNSKGQVAAELCADNGTYEAIRSFELHQQQSPGKIWQFSRDMGPGEDIIGSRLQYEPFFVPRQPVIRSQQYKKEFQRIGMLMFNRQPGFGLAFLVASGVARDYPVDMSTFLRRSKVDIKQVGGFLGEAFSLSHTIRLEFINSVVLQNTGVVSALIQVFHMLQLPDDLQKINRLVHGVARIWWRQHERMLKDLSSGNAGVHQRQRAAGEAPQLHLSEELVGLELKQYLTSSDALHQLMFSAVLLHWYVYRDNAQPKREMEYEVWKQLNVGIEQGGGDVPEHVQQQIHTLIGKAFIPELAVATDHRGGRNRGDAAAGGPDEGGGHGPADDGRLKASSLGPYAAAEGWVQIVGGGFPRPQGMSGVQTVTYKHVSSIFSEVTHNSSGMPFGSPLMEEHGGRQRLQHAQGQPATAEAGSGPSMPGLSSAAGGVAPGTIHTAAAQRRDDQAWLSLCYTLLFFSASPQFGVPYAFIELRKVCVAAVDEEAHVLAIVGAPEPEECDGDTAAAGIGPPLDSTACNDPSGTKGSTPINIVLLLPDGRWQELSLPRLELRLPSSVDLATWSTHLIAACQGKVSKPAITPIGASSGGPALGTRPSQVRPPQHEVAPIMPGHPGGPPRPS